MTAAGPSDLTHLLAGLSAIIGEMNRLAAAVHQNAAAGIPPWPGGRPPYGYTIVSGFLVVDPPAAEVVRTILGAPPGTDLGPHLRRMPGAAAWRSANLRVLVARVRRRAASYRAGEVATRNAVLRHPSLVLVP